MLLLLMFFIFGGNEADKDGFVPGVSTGSLVASGRPALLGQPPWRVAGGGPAR